MQTNEHQINASCAGVLCTNSLRYPRKFRCPNRARLFPADRHLSQRVIASAANAETASGLCDQRDKNHGFFGGHALRIQKHRQEILYRVAHNVEKDCAESEQGNCPEPKKAWRSKLGSKLEFRSATRLDLLATCASCILETEI